MPILTDTNSKLHPPDAYSIAARPRLFAQLDQCRQSRVAWISGPAGSGKTALVASYLASRGVPCVWYNMDGGDADPATFFFYLVEAFAQFLPLNGNPFPVLSPEYLLGLDIYAIRFLEWVATVPASPRVIVIEDYHDLPHDAEIHQVLGKAFAHLPQGLSVLVISREQPHACYARLRANKVMSVLSPNALTLTLDEALEVTSALAPELPADLVSEFHRHTKGWVAGLVLLIDYHLLVGASAQTPVVTTPQGIIDYFASEIMGQPAAKPFETFLLQTAAFPEMTAAMAQELTGREDASQTLSMLRVRHYFTDVYLNAEPVYSYHPLFREFLTARARTHFGADGFRAILNSAARIAEQHGRSDAAAELYGACRDWAGLTSLLARTAQGLIAQGRTKTVIEWLDKAPAAEVDRHPWLLYWLGIAELSTGSCSKARSQLERALGIFDHLGDADGVYQAWSAIVDSHFFQMQDWHPLDHWIFVLGDFLRRYPAFPSGATQLKVALSAFTAYVLRQTDHDNIRMWQQRLEAQLPQADLATRVHAGLITSLYHLCAGNYHRNRLMLDQLASDLLTSPNAGPLSAVTLKLLQSMHYLLTAYSFQCRLAIEEGASLAISTGIYAWSHHYGSCSVKVALLDGDLDGAAVLLREMGQNLSGGSTIRRFDYHLLGAWLHYLKDEIGAALSHLEMCHGPAMTIGLPFYEGVWSLAMAQVKLRRNGYDEAQRLLQQALGISRRIRSQSLEMMASLHLAQFWGKLSRHEEALEWLRAGLALGRDKDYFNFLWWLPTVIADLCALALQEGIETEYVRKLIRHRGLFPTLPPVEIEEWPWEVTIRCLGKIEVRVRGDLVQIQKKPLELLQAIIALGSFEVKCERIVDLLWPDSEGDAGMSSLKVTLHRLRNLVGEGSILLKDGRLTLNNRKVWLDAWAFERLCLKSATEWCKEGGLAVTQKLTHRAMSLYGGRFAEDDQEQEWCHRQREKLSRIYVAVVNFLGNRCLSAGDVDGAIAAFQKGLEAEPLTETFYEGLTKAYLLAGYRVKALQVYKIYESRWRDDFDAEPGKPLDQLIAEISTVRMPATP